MIYGIYEVLCIAVKYRLTPFFAERQGERDEMQDEHVLMEDITNQISNLHPSV